MGTTINYFTPQTVLNLEDAMRVSYGQELAQAPEYPSRLFGNIQVDGTNTTINFPQPTVKIYHRGPMGDDLTFDTIAWAQRKVTVEPWGNGLQMYRYQNDDLQRRNNIDTAAIWATQCGKKAAWFPARGLRYLFRNGDNADLVSTWAGQPLWSTTHPIGGNSEEEFENTFSGMPLTAQNLAAGVAYLDSIRDAQGDPMMLGSRACLAVASNYRARATQLLGAEFLTDIFNVQASATNIFKAGYGFTEPIIAPDWSDEPGTWYLISETWNIPEEAPVNIMTLEDFTITSFNGSTNVELARAEKLEWHHKARIGFAAGKPERILRFKAAGSQTSTRMADILTKL